MAELNGPQHYREATTILANIKAKGGDQEIQQVRSWAAVAQAHATLASAAATIDAAAHPGQSHVDYLGQWWEVQG